MNHLMNDSPHVVSWKTSVHNLLCGSLVNFSSMFFRNMVVFSPLFNICLILELFEDD